MRIVVMGQAPFGAKVLEALTDRGDNVIAVYVPADKPGGKDDPLKASAVQRGIPVYQPESYKTSDAFEQFKSLNPDLLVMAFVTDIIPEKFFDVPPMGAICYHPSILPRHRGASAINWAVIMGDAETGLTVFRPDGGIDTGPILLQKRVPIQPEDTTGSLYFDKLFPMGVDALLESVDMIKQGKAAGTVQDEAGATYEPPCDDKVAAVDWSRPARQIYDLIRGCDPQPGAYATIRGEKVRLYGAKFRDEPVAQAPGTIVTVEDQGLDVAADGGVIRITKVRTASGKGGAGEFAKSAGLTPGERL